MAHGPHVLDDILLGQHGKYIPLVDADGLIAAIPAVALKRTVKGTAFACRDVGADFVCGGRTLEIIPVDFGPDIADSIGPDISTVRAGDILPVAVDDLEIAVALAVELDGADDIVHEIPTVERTGDLAVKIQRDREQQFVFGVRVVAGEYI